MCATNTGPIDGVGLFGYRTGVLESEVIKPLVLNLLDPEQPAVPPPQFAKALAVVESWMVRRMLVRATTKNYNQVVAELIAELHKSNRATWGDDIEAFLAKQKTGSRYWPDNVELEQELVSLQAYRRLGRGRLRMVLEAIEDHLRGWSNGQHGLGDERVGRAKLAIEHVMPRKWHTHWAMQDGSDETERESLIHTLGNLTLLTGKINSKVSNGPWSGNGGKRASLEKHDVLILNRDLLKRGADQWTDQAIRARTKELVRVISQIWPVPTNHRSGFARDKPTVRRKVDLSDLIAGGKLEPGLPLYPRRKQHSHRVATLLPDGTIDVDGIAFSSPTEAATAIAGKRTNGWWFFVTDQATKRSLRNIRRDYIDAMSVDADDDDQGDDEDDDETS